MSHIVMNESFFDEKSARAPLMTMRDLTEQEKLFRDHLLELVGHLGAARAIVPDAKAPEEVAWNQEQDGEERQEHQQGIVAFSDDVAQRVVLHERVGNEKGSKEKHLLPIDINGVFPVLPGTVREDIHEFQALQRKEAEGSVNHKDPREEGRPADQHKEERQDLWETPMHAAARDRINKHEERLEHSADSCQLKLAPENLQHFISWAHQHLIKASRPYHGGEGVEAARAHLREGELHQENGKAEQNLVIGVPLDTVKALEHKVQTQKNAEGDKELTEHHKKEGNLILHGAADIDADIMQPEP